MANVSLKNVSKIYKGSARAVNNVSLEIHDREFVVLVGPSGCGKSTTLRMIAGLEEISEGEIYIENVLVNDVPAKNRDIAMVFQNYALYPHMTVYENLAFGLQLRRYPKKEIERRVHEAAEILGLTLEMLKRRPKELSGGERQRAAIARALVTQPACVLMDEPTGNLDRHNAARIQELLLELSTRHRAAFLVVTHDPDLAARMSRVLRLTEDGLE